ncbi:hypothetical protein [Nocardioides jejuensis]|uniref:Uncharacterized protein n=1 Tax=Nocardioides jejuensis TaxID=2502782 RepID=A0A4R1CGY8_9ACTN|nr:hypothetical protein [Nocardioides jejuensis]TCJ30429.1 hypothetical protein EPD65_04315 [Nocardioides jejuensis]
MPAARFMPYETPDAESVQWDAWWFVRGGVREALPQQLPGWDYSSVETIGVTVHLDTEAIKSATGMQSARDLELVLIADCAPLGRRFVGAASIDEEAEETVDLSVEIPAGEAALQLEVSAHLVLASPGEPGSGRPHLAGSRLLSSQRRTVQLEGEASRFPSEAVPFSAIGLEPAPWTISASFADLNDSFMGSIRLLMNEEHPLARAALDPVANPEAAERLKIDVFRMLVAVVAPDIPECAEQYEEASVGEVVTNMADLYLRQTLVEAASMYRENPLRFERLCYSAVNE